MALESASLTEGLQYKQEAEVQRTSMGGQSPNQPAATVISIVVPAYNEASILEENLTALCRYLRELEDEYRWELIVINDGSRDDTGKLAEAFASTHSNVYVIHHRINLGLGQALKTGFAHSQGDYIVTLDLDLSYSPQHIEKLLFKIRETGANVVVTSPYIRGGKVSNVPWLRLFLSVWANRFLSFTAKRDVSTLTGMVRVYDAAFLKDMNFRATGMDINPEVIHKTRLLRGRIEEIPAHLNWHKHKAGRRTGRVKRKSSMKILRHTWETIFHGFVFRPAMFFIVPSFFFFLLSLYANAWVLIHCWTNYQRLAHTTSFPDLTEAVAIAFQQAPHAFIIGGITLMLSIQLFSLGILALQSKHYFEEMFYLSSAIYRSTRQRKGR